jgi:Flp pilus assembly protein protease CpaA
VPTRKPAATFDQASITSDSVPLWSVGAAGLAGLVALQLALPVTSVTAATTIAIVQVFAVLAAVVDHREGRIPNRTVFWTLGSVLAAGSTLSWGTGTFETFWVSLAAGLVIGAVLTVLSLLTGGIGMGDVKFLTVASVALWMVAPIAVGIVIVISFAGVAIQSVLNRSTNGVPMAPWIAVALIPALLIVSSGGLVPVF